MYVMIDYPQKAPLGFLPYFMLGEALAIVYEGVHWLSPLSTPTPSSSSPYQVISNTLWRFSPDMLGLVISVLMSPFDAFSSNGASLALKFGGIPFLFSAFLLISLLQKEHARMNFIRYFLETPLMQLMGYCSYSACKLLLY